MLAAASSFAGEKSSVSSRFETDAELRKFAGLLTEAQRIARIGNWEWNIIDNHLWWSDEIYRIFGIERTKFGSSYEAFLNAVHPDDRDLVNAAVDEALTNGTPYSIDHRVVLPDGTEKTVHEQAEVTRDIRGNPTRMAGTAHDITDRRAAERALLISESRLRALLDAMPDMIFRLNREGTFLEFHGPKDAPLVFAEEEFLGRTLSEIFPAAHAERSMALLRKTLETRKTHAFVYELAVEGKPRQFEARYVCSGPSEVVAVVRDTTEQQLAMRQIEELKEQLMQENVRLRKNAMATHAFEPVIGSSAKLSRCMQLARTVAPTDIPVLILGETGTGKELFARAIHQLSDRHEEPLISVNCPALPAEIIESELFGHEKGAFTSAHSRRVGRFEAANGGTLFLDEIGDLPLELQGKLLRVIQEKEFERVGGSEPIAADVRLIAATNRDLRKEVENGDFRADLFYRIGNFPVVLPPLRERAGDIALLAEYFVRKHATLLKKEVNTISPALLEHLERYAWPGNVRELEGYIIRLILTATGRTLDLPDVASVNGIDLDGGAANDEDAVTALGDAERRHILKVLDKTRWVITGKNGAAQALGVPPSTLRSKMARLGIQRP